jgi:hypothetical protein
MPMYVSDAIAGAVGEVAQIILLYPLESIKVRCQADGISAREVIVALGKEGWGKSLPQLYSGLGSAAVLSIFVGERERESPARECVTRALQAQAVRQAALADSLCRGFWDPQVPSTGSASLPPSAPP